MWQKRRRRQSLSAEAMTYQLSACEINLCHAAVFAGDEDHLRMQQRCMPIQSSSTQRAVSGAVAYRTLAPSDSFSLRAFTANSGPTALTSNCCRTALRVTVSMVSSVWHPAATTSRSICLLPRAWSTGCTLSSWATSTPATRSQRSSAQAHELKVTWVIWLGGMLCCNRRGYIHLRQPLCRAP